MRALEEQEDLGFYLELTIDTLAKTIWGEARKYDLDMKRGVCSVILNRLQISESKLQGHWWGNNIIQICQKPYQFECWNRSTPEYQNLKNVTEDDYVYKACRQIAVQAVQGHHIDVTSGCTHYHHALTSPYWASRETPKVIIGSHKFYKLT